MKKKVVALGVSCALAISPFTSLTVKASTKSVSADFQSVSQLSNIGKQEVDNKFSEDTIIIKYSRALSLSDHQRAGGIVVQQVSGLNYVAVKVKNKSKLQQTIQKYQKNSKVVSVNLSPIYKHTGTIDPKSNEQYVHNVLKTKEAQKLAGKNQVKIAVIDQGIDRNHPELKGSIIASTNVIDPMNPTVADFHGTHVAGIIAAKKDNGIGGYGLNSNAKILSYDVFGGGGFTFDYVIANAILKAVDQGAKVINMSLGSTMPSVVLQEAVEKAIDSGVVVVAAAGNDGMDLASYPASYEGVISVGSVNNDQKLSTFSTYGASTDVVAPGEDIYAPTYDALKGSTFERLSGTSMASPAVAGAATLLLTKYPKLTPAEVEYILEKTATDLGTKGFDVKYGNGLINPLAAMKFNVNTIPSLVKKTWGKKEIINNAQVITAPATVDSALTKPSEQKWVKLAVKKGEYIQTSLSSTAPYDYKMSIHFYGDNEQQLTDVNEVKEGKTEAKLIQAPFSGTVAIGVKDVNGNYADTKNSQSTFTLQVDKLASMPEDESTVEAPIEIATWPFSQSDLYITGEEGDNDFFHFTSKEAQLLKFDVTGIPGVNISASVYEKDQLFPPVMEEGTGELPISEEGKESSIIDVPIVTDDTVVVATEDTAELEQPSIDDLPALYTSNLGGIGEGETLSFQVDPEKEYYLKVTNKQSPYEYSIEDLLMSLLSGYAVEDEAKAPAYSALPYTVQLKGKTIPEDEDNYMGISTSTEDESSQSSELSSIKDDSKRIAELETVALPYAIGKSVQGYLQTTIDQDWYKVSPITTTGIYQFDLPMPTTNLPLVELYEIVETEEEDGTTSQYLTYVTSNTAMNSYNWNEPYANTFKTGLKANKSYFLAVNPNYMTGQVPYDGYEIQSKLLVGNTGDAYEDNDKPEQAQNFPAKGVKANFSTTNDVDTYYFTAPQNGTFGIKFARTQLTTALQSKYAKELLSPFYAYMVISEDVNKNRKAEEQDTERSMYLLNYMQDGTTTGSFEAKKGQAYFVTVMGLVDSTTGLSLWPYQLNIDAVNKKDEDADSKVTNNKPSKPLALQKKTSKLYSATASLNAGYQSGDVDWFVYKATKTEQATIKLDAGTGIDGVIEVYKNGKKVAKSDYYGKNDQEILNVKLTKGTYYFKIRDAKGYTSFTPYTLSVKLK